MKVQLAASFNEVSELRRYQAQNKSKMMTTPTAIPVTAQIVGVVLEMRSAASVVSVLARKMLICASILLSSSVAA